MTVMEYVILGLVILSLVLHVVAPMTKNTKDDKALEIVDAVKDALPKKLPEINKLDSR